MAGEIDQVPIQSIGFWSIERAFFRRKNATAIGGGVIFPSLSFIKSVYFTLF